MSRFKEAGSYSQVNVHPSVINGGVYLPDMYSVKTEVYRLRKIGEEESRAMISEQDVTPIKLYPKELEDGLRLPSEESIKVGDEREYSVIDAKTGELVDLYGKNSIKVNGTGEVRYLNTGSEHWLIDELGGSPEALRFQLELGSTPENWLPNYNRGVIFQTGHVLSKCREKGLLLLPVGLTGEKIARSWENVAPHPYIGSIHHHSLNGSAIDFDAQTLQTHVDLAPFGYDEETSVEFAILVGNHYNQLLATMMYGLATSSPFYQGRITNKLSNREDARNKLSTVGGVQEDIPVNHASFFSHGDRLVRNGAIPVPERAGSHQSTRGDGSHKDYRPKLSLGTAEFGGPDMNPNEWLRRANAIILRSFVHRTAQAVLNDEPLPSFMQNIDIKKRRRNREAVCLLGNNAMLETGKGNMHISDAWDAVFEWMGYTRDHTDRQKMFAQATVKKALNTSVDYRDGTQAIQRYFDRNRTDTFFEGNFAVAMREYAKAHSAKTEGEKIRATNLEVARQYDNYMNSEANRIASPFTL